MKTTKLTLLAAFSAFALACLTTGCERTVSETETQKTREDGSTVSKEKKETQSPDGTVTKTEEKKTTPPQTNNVP